MALQMTPKSTNERDDSACLTCVNSEMGYCKVRNRHVAAFDNCSDFDNVKMYVLHPNFVMPKEMKNDQIQK